ncbi:MAG: hypothetical protein RJB30_541 [Actinomycetota bacterium]
MIDFATQLVESIGIFGAGLFIAIESVVIPLPSEFVLLLSGFNVSSGEFAFFPLLVATTTGSLIGALFLYTVGFGVSRRRVDSLITGYGRFVGIRKEDVDRAFVWFERHGAQAVLFGRLLPVVRSLVSIPAGLSEMNILKFATFTVIGSGIWNSIWIYIGLQLGDRWRDAEGWANYLDFLVAVIGVIVILVLARRAFALKKRGN